MRTLLYLFMICVFIGCNEKVEPKEDLLRGKDITQEVISEKEEKPQQDEPTPPLQKACYIFEKANNYINLEITEIGEEIFGTLIYDINAAPLHKGSFKGELIDDKLFGIFSYKTEEGKGKREMAFQVSGDRLIEGYGLLTKDRTEFVDRDKIIYATPMPLTKAECEQ